MARIPQLFSLVSRSLLVKLRLGSAALALCALVLAGSSLAAAQDASPVGSDVACDVEPRSADELLALWYGDATAPDATPIAPSPEEEPTPAEVTIPLGEPADPETVAAISETIYQVTACFAAGDVLRSYALFTDDLARLFGPEPGTPREVAEAFLAGGGEDEEGEQSEILAFASVMLLEDGRASAFIVDRYPSEDVLTYVHFEREGDTWLADEVIEFPSLLPEEEED